jgi:hypothetical protein
VKIFKRKKENNLNRLFEKDLNEILIWMRGNETFYDGSMRIYQNEGYVSIEKDIVRNGGLGIQKYDDGIITVFGTGFFPNKESIKELIKEAKKYAKIHGEKNEY